MHESAIAVVCINPARLKAFARSEGVKAKSDCIDSRMILQFAEQKQLRLLEQPQKIRQQIAVLMDRRAQLKKLLSSEKNRIDKSDDIALNSIEQVIEFIQEQIQTIETKIQKLISNEPLLAALFDRLTQIKGVGPCTAWSILAYLRELGTLKRTKIAALVGLAPYLKESGTFKGKRKIEGGRAKVRNALYMAAHTACTYNPVIHEYAQRLELKGKSKKWIKVAAMRKLLMHIHFLTKKLLPIPCMKTQLLQEIAMGWGDYRLLQKKGSGNPDPHDLSIGTNP